jgi:hypothetical protein
MATPAIENASPACVQTTHVDLGKHTDDFHRSTAQERREMKEKSRWLRRVVNPFVDFNTIIAIGASGSPSAAGAIHRPEDRLVRDHAKDL